ncbi:MAG: Kelch repeat-containing protein, partial [bacterium]
MISQGNWQWTEVSPMNEPRTGMAVAVWRGKIFVFGGARTLPRPDIIASAEVYDPDSDQWSYIEPLPIPLFQASALSVNEGIILLGGLTQRGLNNRVFLYNPLRNSYQILTQMPHARYSFRVTLLRDDLLLIGGVGEEHQYERNNLWWRRTNNQWEKGPENIYPCGGAALVKNPEPLLIGGNYQGLLDRIEVFRNGRWMIWNQTRLPQPRSDMGAAIVGDSLLIIAGGSLSMMRGTNTSWGYSFPNRQWLILPEMAYSRTGLELVEVEGKAYAIGGANWGRGMEVSILRVVEVLTYAQSTPPEGDPPITGRTNANQLPTIWLHNGVIMLPDIKGVQSLYLYDLYGREVFHILLSNNFSRNLVYSLPTG